jgi:hypothetical protein
MTKSRQRTRIAPRRAPKAKKRPSKASEAVAANPGDYGWFEGCVHACWLKDGRDMALLEPLVFHQTQGQRTWTAPVGTLTDGASSQRSSGR